MTRTTVYEGSPDDDDPDVASDLFHEYDGDAHVVIETGAGDRIELRQGEWMDVYVTGEPADD